MNAGGAHIASALLFYLLGFFIPSTLCHEPRIKLAEFVVIIHPAIHGAGAIAEFSVVTANFYPAVRRNVERTEANV